MASPSLSEVHVLRPLQNFQIAYMNELASCWNTNVPNIPSQFKADKFAIFPETYWLRAGGAYRAPGTQAARVDFHITYGQFNCENIEVEYALDDQLRANFDSQLNADASAIRLITRNLVLNREQRATSRFLQSGVWSLDFEPNRDGRGYWDASNSDPIKDVRELKRYTLGKTGIEPNTLFLTQDVVDALLDNQSLVYRYNFVGTGGILDVDKLAQAFGIAKVVIHKGVVDGQALPGTNPGFMATGQFLLAYVTAGASTTDATAMACFNWTGYEGAGALGNTVERYRREEIRSDMYRGRFACDYQVTAPSLGIYGMNCLTPSSSGAGLAGTNAAANNSGSASSTSTTPASSSASTSGTSSSAGSTSSTST